MKTSILILLAVCATSFYSLAQENDEETEKSVYFGMGISTDPLSALYGYSFFDYSGFGLGSDFQFPINISKLRLEPEIGFFIVSEEVTTTPGLAIMASLQPRPKFYVLPGIRSKFFLSERSTLMALQLITQLEYRPIDFFGFGIEPNISAYWESNGGLSELEFSELINTGARINLRFYF